MTSPERLAQARRVAPILLLDDVEPFRPTHVTITEQPCQSHSGRTTLEYAIAWTADIGHVQEVEHVWVSIDTDTGRPLAVQASSHGNRRDIRVPEGGRPTVLCEPGKHAGADSPNGFELPRDLVEWWCREAAGLDGVAAWSGRSATESPTRDRRAMHALVRRAFTPSWRFGIVIDTADLPWVDAREWADRLAASTALFIDDQCPDPLALPCGGWSSRHPVVGLCVARHRDDDWVVDGLPLPVRLRQAQQSQRRVILDVGDASEAAMADLWERAWTAYATSRLIIVGSIEAAGYAMSVGFRAGHRAAPFEKPSRNLPWVVTSTPDQTEQWLEHRFVIGPGQADIEYSSPSP